MRNHLFGIGTFAVLAVSGPVYAADVAPAYKVAPTAIAAPSWTGFYVGAGAGFRTSQTDVTTTSILVNGTAVPTTAPGLSFNGTAPRVSPYVGFNWQIAPQWIVGLEGDYGFANNTSSVVGVGFTSINPPPNFPQTFIGDSLVVRTAWDASLRARAGFLFTPSTLGYVTGGAAWQHSTLTSTCSIANGFLGIGDCSFNSFINPTGLNVGPSVIKSSITKAGWTVGGGLETMLWGSWLARGEYRYANFGTSPFSIVRTAIGGNGSIGTSAGVAVQTHSVTFGLAYKFN